MTTQALTTPTGRGPLKRGRAFGRLMRGAISLALGLLAVGLVGSASTPAQAGQRLIRLSFPDPPNVFCGIGELPNIHAYPETGRAEVEKVLAETYDDIVTVYGEPQVTVPVAGSPPRPLDYMPVDVFYAPGAGGSMYLTHKSDLKLRGMVLMALLSLYPVQFQHPALQALAVTCAATAELPDHALFLSVLPNEPGFKHHVLHELIHIWHDQKSYENWYTHSWVEEGMTEAAAELVTDMRILDGRNLADQYRAGGINHGPADNLKHYDMWSYPQNGAWRGDGGFSTLHGTQFFFGGFAVPEAFETAGGLLPGLPGDHEWMNKVIEPDVRYAAAVAQWLLLAKALSDDPAHPDFLRRLNEQLDRDGIDGLPDESWRANEVIFDAIAEVAGAKTIEGLPAREWLNYQWPARSFPAAESGLFIDIRNPENAIFDPSGRRVDAPDITVYAMVADDFPSASNALGWFLRDGLQMGELPVKECPITLKIRSIRGRPLRMDPVLGRYVSELLPATGITDDSGRMTFAQTDNVRDVLNFRAPKPGGGFYASGELPPGAYAVHAEAGLCPHRVTFRHWGIWPFRSSDSTLPAGMFGATYFMVDDNPTLVSDDINVGNPFLYGVTTTTNSPLRSSRGGLPVVVPAQPQAQVVPAAGPRVWALGRPELAMFRFLMGAPTTSSRTDPAAYVPREILIGMPDPKNPHALQYARQVLKPSPYTRAVWTGVQGDFDMSLSRSAATLEAGQSATATITLTPNGVLKGPALCAVTLREEQAPPRGVRITFEPNVRFSAMVLDDNAPDPSTVTMTVEVSSAATTGRTHRIGIVGSGAPGECADIERVQYFDLDIPPPEVIAEVDAIWLRPAGAPEAVNPVIEVTAPSGASSPTAPTAITLRQGSRLDLRAPADLEVGGRHLRFVDWIYDDDVAQHDERNPVSLHPTQNVKLTARFVASDQASVTVEATAEGGTVPVRIPVPIRYQHLGARQLQVDATKVTGFQITPPSGAAVTVEAPIDVSHAGKRYEFTHWAIGGAVVSQAKMVRQAGGSATWTARYREVEGSRLGLSIFPPAAQVSAGGAVTLDLRIDNVSDVYGAQVELGFDAALAQVVDADPRVAGVQLSAGEFLAPVDVLSNRVDNAAGRIEFAASLRGAAVGASGSGVLARIQFKGVSAGTGAISFQTGLVSDRASWPVDVESQDGALTVTRPPPGAVFFPVQGVIDVAGRSDKAGTRVCIRQRCATTGQDGSFHLPDAHLGDRLDVSHPGFLSVARRLGRPPDEDGNLSLPPVTLLAGDIDQDKEIGAADAVAIAKSWNARQGDGRFVTAADLNADRRIDQADLAAAQAHFLWTAPGPWPDPPEPSPQPSPPAPPSSHRELGRATPEPPEPWQFAALASVPSPRLAYPERGSAKAWAEPAADEPSQISATVRASLVTVAEVGRPARVDITVDDVRDLFAYGVRIRFDPRIIAIRDVDAAQPGAQVTIGDVLDSGDRLEVFNVGDNISGEMQFTVSRRFPALGRSGSGVLASIVFDSLAEGTSPIVLGRVELFDAAFPGASRLPATVYDGQVRVGGRSKAPLYLPLLVRDPTICPTPDRFADVVLVIDAGRSMGDATAAGRRKLDAATDAARALLDGLRLEPGGDRAAVVAFSDQPQVLQDLTPDRRALDAALARIGLGGSAYVDLGVYSALARLHGALSQPNRLPAIVVLSDGAATPAPGQAAIEAAQDAKDVGVRVFVIGIAPASGEPALRAMASGGRRFWLAAGAESLPAIFRDLPRSVQCPPEGFWGGR